MTLSTQFLTMLSMIGMGSLFGAMFDTYQRFLNRPKQKRLIIFYTLFLVNNGELRFYIFIALICGFAAYQSLFKGIYLRLLEFLIQTIISLVKFIIKVLLSIVKIILSIFQKILLIFWKLLPKSLKKSVEKLYNRTAGKF